MVVQAQVEQVLANVDMKDILETALTSIRARVPYYQKYREYDLGLHNLRYATDKFRQVFGSLFSTFSDNLCPAVVEAVNDKLTIKHFEVGTGISDDGTDSEISEPAKKVWVRNRMDRISSDIMREAVLVGDSFAIVWPGEDGENVIYHNKPELMAVEYDEEDPGRLLWATKIWYSERHKRYRANIYFEDRVEKFWMASQSTDRSLPTSAKSFQSFDQEEGGSTLSNPFSRVPVFHFANNCAQGEYGVSELLNVIPLQDALNKAITDLLVAMEFVAMPQRHATGIHVQVDSETGKPLSTPFTPGVDRIWTTPNEDARFGQFEQADLSGFIKVQEDLRMAIARTSGTPAHYLMLSITAYPSGEAMKTAETRFLAKVQKRQVSYGNAWEDLMTCAIGGDMDEPVVTTIWQDPIPRSAKEWVDVLEVKHRIGVPEEQLWKEMGYSDERIGEMRILREEEVEREMVLKNNAFSRGQELAQKPERQPRNEGKGPPQRDDIK